MARQPWVRLPLTTDQSGLVIENGFVRFGLVVHHNKGSKVGEVQLAVGLHAYHGRFRVTEDVTFRSNRDNEVRSFMAPLSPQLLEQITKGFNLHLVVVVRVVEHAGGRSVERVRIPIPKASSSSDPIRVTLPMVVMPHASTLNHSLHAAGSRSVSLVVNVEDASLPPIKLKPFWVTPTDLASHILYPKRVPSGVPKVRNSLVLRLSDIDPSANLFASTASTSSTIFGFGRLACIYCEVLHGNGNRVEHEVPNSDSSDRTSFAISPGEGQLPKHQSYVGSTCLDTRKSIWVPTGSGTTASPSEEVVLDIPPALLDDKNAQIVLFFKPPTSITDEAFGAESNNLQDSSMFAFASLPLYGSSSTSGAEGRMLVTNGTYRLPVSSVKSRQQFRMLMKDQANFAKGLSTIGPSTAVFCGGLLSHDSNSSTKQELFGLDNGEPYLANTKDMTHSGIMNSISESTVVYLDIQLSCTNAIDPSAKYVQRVIKRLGCDNTQEITKQEDLISNAIHQLSLSPTIQLIKRFPELSGTIVNRLERQHSNGTQVFAMLTFLLAGVFQDSYCNHMLRNALESSLFRATSSAILFEYLESLTTSLVHAKREKSVRSGQYAILVIAMTHTCSALLNHLSDTEDAPGAVATLLARSNLLLDGSGSKQETGDTFGPLALRQLSSLERETSERHSKKIMRAKVAAEAVLDALLAAREYCSFSTVWQGITRVYPSLLCVLSPKQVAQFLSNMLRYSMENTKNRMPEDYAFVLQCLAHVYGESAHQDAAVNVQHSAETWVQTFILNNSMEYVTWLLSPNQLRFIIEEDTTIVSLMNSIVEFLECVLGLFVPGKTASSNSMFSNDTGLFNHEWTVTKLWNPLFIALNFLFDQQQASIGQSHLTYSIQNCIKRLRPFLTRYYTCEVTSELPELLRSSNAAMRSRLIVLLCKLWSPRNQRGNVLNSEVQHRQAHLTFLEPVVECFLELDVSSHQDVGHELVMREYCHYLLDTVEESITTNVADSESMALKLLASQLLLRYLRACRQVNMWSLASNLRQALSASFQFQDVGRRVLRLCLTVPYHASLLAHGLSNILSGQNLAAALAGQNMQDATTYQLLLCMSELLYIDNTPLAIPVAGNTNANSQLELDSDIRDGKEQVFTANIGLQDLCRLAVLDSARACLDPGREALDTLPSAFAFTVGEPPVSLLKEGTEFAPTAFEMSMVRMQRLETFLAGLMSVENTNDEKSLRFNPTDDSSSFPVEDETGYFSNQHLSKQLAVLFRDIQFLRQPLEGVVHHLTPTSLNGGTESSDQQVGSPHPPRVPPPPPDHPPPGYNVDGERINIDEPENSEMQPDMSQRTIQSSDEQSHTKQNGTTKKEYFAFEDSPSIHSSVSHLESEMVTALGRIVKVLHPSTLDNSARSLKQLCSSIPAPLVQVYRSTTEALNFQRTLVYVLRQSLGMKGSKRAIELGEALETQVRLHGALVCLREFQPRLRRNTEESVDTEYIEPVFRLNLCKDLSNFILDATSSVSLMISFPSTTEHQIDVAEIGAIRDSLRGIQQCVHATLDTYSDVLQGTLVPLGFVTTPVHATLVSAQLLEQAIRARKDFDLFFEQSVADVQPFDKIQKHLEPRVVHPTLLGLPLLGTAILDYEFVSSNPHHNVFHPSNWNMVFSQSGVPETAKEVIRSLRQAQEAFNFIPPTSPVLLSATAVDQAPYRSVHIFPQQALPLASQASSEIHHLVLFGTLYQNYSDVELHTSLLQQDSDRAILRIEVVLGPEHSRVRNKSSKTNMWRSSEVSSPVLHVEPKYISLVEACTEVLMLWHRRFQLILAHTGWPEQRHQPILCRMLFVGLYSLLGDFEFQTCTTFIEACRLVSCSKVSNVASEQAQFKTLESVINDSLSVIQEAIRCCQVAWGADSDHGKQVKALKASFRSSLQLLIDSVESPSDS